MFCVALVAINNEESSIISGGLEKMNVRVEWLPLINTDFIPKYDIFVIPPDVELANIIYDNHPKRPYIFVMDGHEIDYHTLKQLVNLGIAGLIENADISPLLKIARLVQKTKAAYKRLSKKMDESPVLQLIA